MDLEPWTERSFLDQKVLQVAESIFLRGQGDIGKGGTLCKDMKHPCHERECSACSHHSYPECTITQVPHMDVVWESSKTPGEEGGGTL